MPQPQTGRRQSPGLKRYDITVTPLLLTHHNLIRQRIYRLNRFDTINPVNPFNASTCVQVRVSVDENRYIVQLTLEKQLPQHQ